ncbi:MAG: hypothetical protein J0L88_12010 [Xanthomonadales bacterium]|nr:hypothetical protein [Xanthomonadales bacterium]
MDTRTPAFISRLRARFVIAVLVACLLAPALGFAGAGGPAPDGAPFTRSYEYDPTFAADGIAIDHFAGSNTADFVGRKLVRLDNGDVVVAGLATRSGFPAPDQIGLVRYNAAGQRVAWSAVSAAYGEFGNQYVVYPKGNSGQPIGSFTELIDVQEYGGNLYVLANLRTVLNDVRPIFVVFSTTGVHRGWWTWYPSNNAPARGFIIQTVATQGARIVMVGDEPAPSGPVTTPRIWMARLAIGANGTLALDAGFGNGGFAYSRGVACTTAATAQSCPTWAAAIASEPGPVVSTNPKFYVAVSVRRNNQTLDGLVLRFNGNGSRDLDFAISSTGYDEAVIAFDDGGNDADVPVAMATGYHIEIPLAYVDDIYVAANVSRATRPGIGLVRFDGEGDLDPAFGTGGRTLFGGCGTGTGNCNFFNVEAVAWSMARDGNRLAIGGRYRGFLDQSGSDFFTYPLFAVIDAGSGSVVNFDEYPTGEGDGAFYGVVANGDGRFTLAGDVESIVTGGSLSYLTARIAPLDDRIFANGFE